MSILKNGTILNRNQYKITRFIAQGGFGITYLAEEIGFYKHSGYGEEYIEVKNPETVVIKELYYNDYCQRDDKTGLVSISNIDKKLEFQKLVKNQIDEGKTIRSLKHPNIVRTRDIFHENETAYMVMDYIESTDLEEMLKEKKTLPKEKALKYIFQMLDAVDYIHTKIDKKILHLDISPSNILIDKSNDNAILIDFGSALSYDNIQNNITSTTSQIVTGRKKYYSPNEQGDIDNLKSFDATFDTYAIGATLYHLLSGEKPPLSSLVSTGRMKITPPSELRNDGEKFEYLDAIVMKSIAPMYKSRYSSAAQFAIDLKQEASYNEDILKIQKLCASREFSKAFDLIKSAKEKYPPTPQMEILEKDIKKEVEKIEKEKEFKVFLDKGDNMFATGEFEFALRFFNNAKEIFPENQEVIDKINLCNEQLGKEKIPEQEPEQEEKDETVLLKTPSKPEAPKVDSDNLFAGFDNIFEEITQKEKEKPPKEQVDEDATELLSRPQPKEEPIPQNKPAQETKKAVTPNESGRSKKNLIIGSSVIGVLGLSAVLYTTGVFSSEVPDPQNKVLVQDSIGNYGLTDSISADQVLIGDVNTKLIQPETNKIPENSNEDEDEDKDENKKDWRTEFNLKFNTIYKSESAGAESAVNKYKNLLTTIPSDGLAEKKKVNNRIAALNKIINTENENADWNTAKRRNTEIAYRDYINQWPDGRYVSEAEQRIINLKPKTKPEPEPESDIYMAEYNKNLDWAKNMISVDGCDGCKKNSTCKSQVVSRLQKALKANPNGKEAKELLDCLNN